MYAIGIDSGTQGTKALVVDFTGKVRGRGYAPHKSIENLRPGESEQDPNVWIEALDKSMKAALAGAKIKPRDIVSLGVSGQQHGFVPLDKKGEPIRPAKLWNDTSTVEETEMIVEKMGGKRKFIKKLGISLAVGYTASKILWFKRKEPRHYAKLKTVLLPHDYINYWLTGKLSMEYGDASGTGLMDIRKRVWHREAMAAIDPDLEAKLPPLLHPAEPLGYMKEKIASCYGMKKVLVSSGGGDNMMGAIGTGNVLPGVSTVSLGTSGTIYSYFQEPFVDPEGEIAAFCDSTGGWLPLLCTMNVTNTTEYFKAFLRLSNKDLENMASKAPPGAQSLIFLPFIDGERVPVLPFSTGVLFGLSKRTFNKSYLARSIMEGTILNLGYGFARMRSLGLKPAEIRATGGGAKSRLWLQIVADVFKTPVVTLAEQEAAAYGAALQSVWSYYREKGKKITIEEIAREKVKKERLEVEPQKENFAVYDSLQKRFNSLWKTLTEEFKTHKKQQV
jgi:xylulokinase